ncbi:MAG: uroporphyrinogen decarboxylase family protein [Thermodesulfovibrionales bacterium]
MTAYERMLRAISGRTPDRIPIAPQLFGVSARLNGSTIKRYVTDGAFIAECQMRLRGEIGHDVLFASADLSVEAEALGCPLRYEDDAYPAVHEPLLGRLCDTGLLRRPDPLKDARMPVVLEACARLREAAGDECLVASCMLGPASIAAQVMGIETFLYRLADDPDAVLKVIDFIEMVSIDYGSALLRAGAHCVVVFDPVASPAVLPPSFFSRYEAQRLKRIYASLKAEGACASWISIAGDTRKILPCFESLGINIATIDSGIPLSEVFSLLGAVAVNGTVDTYLFVSGSPTEIRGAVRQGILEARGRSNYIVGSGCEVPVETSFENVRALVEAVEGFHGTP